MHIFAFFTPCLRLLHPACSLHPAHLLHPASQVHPDYFLTYHAQGVSEKLNFELEFMTQNREKLTK